MSARKVAQFDPRPFTGVVAPELWLKLAAAALEASGHTALLREIEGLREALTVIAEGNLGEQSWQAGYDRIREVAVAALSRPLDEQL